MTILQIASGRKVISVPFKPKFFFQNKVVASRSGNMKEMDYNTNDGIKIKDEEFYGIVLARKFGIY